MDAAVSQTRRVTRRREPQRWGAVAVATAGAFTVECDEALSGPSLWQVTVESPALTFSFLVKDRGTLEAARDFLARPDGQSKRADLRLGRSARLLADDETCGRLFLLIGGRASHVRVTLAAEQAKQLASALSDVLEQWVA